MNEIKERSRLVDVRTAAGRLEAGGAVTLSRAPEGYDAFVVAELARAFAAAGEQRGAALVFVARDAARAQAFIDALAFAAPEIEALYLPSWDCQPYDRVSPNPAVSAERMTALARLARSRGSRERPRVLVLYVNALTQRVPPLAYLASAAFSAAPGNSVRMDDLARWLEANGYARASTVRDVGDYASRGGILDLYPPGAPNPIRLDFFGDTLELIRAFDPETQRTVGSLRALDLVPMSEAQLSTETIRRFRQLYAQEFGRRRRPTISTPPSAKAGGRSASSTGCRFSTKASTRSSIMSATRPSSSTRAPRRRLSVASNRSRIPTRRGARFTRKARGRRITSRCRPSASI